MCWVIKEGRFTDNIKTIYLIKFHLYRENLISSNASYRRLNIFFEFMFACVSHDGCVTELFVQSKPEIAGAFSFGTENTGHCPVHPQPELEP